jgi:hypothetical protein
MKRILLTASLVVLYQLFQLNPAFAGGLGIPLDGFLTTFLTFVTGLGTLIFLLGLGSYVYQWISVPHSPLLGNSLTMMVLGGLFGGGPVIATQLGLLAGAVLP